MDGRLHELLDLRDELVAAGQATDSLALCGGETSLAQKLNQLIGRLEAVDKGLNRSLQSSAVPEFVSLGSRLRLSKKLGRGGQGSVYLAYDDVLRREVAVKTPHFQDRESTLRLRKEAEIAARLNHPGIVTILGWGITELQLPFLVMKFVAGTTLADRLQANADEIAAQSAEIRLREAIESVASASKTIDFVHRRGILHCDLKPQNILLGVFGETVVLDWGAAAPYKSSSPDVDPLPITQGSHLLEQARSVGTGEYMSPERLTGSAELGPASDIYSLGAIIHRLVRGPFRSPSRVAVTESDDRFQPGLGAHLTTAASDRLRRLADIACDDRPGKRPNSAQEIARSLESVLRLPLSRSRKRGYFAWLLR